MRPPFSFRAIVVIALAFGLFAGDAFAGFFRRYPDATDEESQPATPTRPAQPEVDDGTEAYTPTAEPEEDPGLFRVLPHGSGGMTFEYIYTGEVFTNMHGGLNTNDATEYRGNLDLVMTADLDAMGFAPGGIIFLYGQNGHGRGISGHVGETQTISNIDAPEFMQMSEFWWERGFYDDIFRLRIGKQDVAAEFAFVELGGDFMNAVFGAPATIPMPTFPDPTMAAVLFTQLTEDLVFQCGVFDGAATGGSWGFSRTGEPFTIMEFRGNYESLRGMPGQYHVGMWHHDGVFENPANANITHHSNKGVYFGADQLLFKENPYDADDDQGLGVFGQYSWAPQDRNAVTQSFIAGLGYKGLLCCRDDDIVGVGVGNATFSNTTPALVNETMVEFFYKMQLTPYTVLQPDLQYIANPSGNGRDAFVAGLRFEVVL